MQVKIHNDTTGKIKIVKGLLGPKLYIEYWKYHESGAYSKEWRPMKNTDFIQEITLEVDHHK